MTEQEKQFTKGFNNGYLIAKYQPDLFEKLEKSNNPENEYFQGLLSGKKEYDAEKKIVPIKSLEQKGAPSKEENDLDKER